MRPVHFRQEQTPSGRGRVSSEADYCRLVLTAPGVSVNFFLFLKRL